MKKLMIMALISGIFFFPSAAQSPEEPALRLSLEDCLQYAFRNSYTREAILLNEESAGEDLRQARLQRTPTLSASVSEGVGHSKGNSASWDGSYGVSTGMTIYQGGSIKNTIEQNRLIVEQTELQTEQYDNQLTIDILEAFLTALGNEELLKYQYSVLEASREQLIQGKYKMEAGQILESDYLLLESQYTSDLNNITDTRISRDNSLVSLKALLSMDPRINVEIVYPDTTAILNMVNLPTEDYVLERALDYLPDLEISRYNVEIAETGLKISRASLYPTVSLSGSFGTGHNSNFNNYGSQLNNRRNEQLGLSVSVPIFNRGTARSRINQSRIALEQVELNDLQNNINITQSIIIEYSNVVSSRNNYQANTVKENAYRRSFEVYRAQFEAGSITTVDLLQQQNNYISALNDYIRSKYGFILQRKILDVYMGIKITM